MMACGDAVDLIQRRIQTYCSDEHAFRNPIKRLAAVFARAVQQRQSDSLFLLGPPGPGKELLIHQAQALLESTSYTDLTSGKSNTALSHHSQAIKIHRAAVDCQLYSETPEKCVEQMILELLGNSHASRTAADNLKKLMYSLTTEKAIDDVDGENDDFKVETTGETRRTRMAKRTEPIRTDELNVSSSEEEDPAYDLILLVIENVEVLLRQSYQVILYELLDRSKQFQPPVVMIGLSDRLDVMESMEKRLRSRFSQRQIVPACCYIRDLGHFFAIVDDMLTFSDTGGNRRATQPVPSSAQAERVDDDLNQVMVNWNSLIVNVMQSKKSLDALEKLFYAHGNNFPLLRSVLEQAVHQLRMRNSLNGSNTSSETVRVGTNAHVESFTQAIEQFLEDEQLVALTGISLVQFIAFVSAMQHVITAPQKTLTISVLADICQNQFVTTKFHASAMSRPSIIEAIKELIDLGLLILDIRGKEKTIQERIPLRVALCRSQLVEFCRDKQTLDRMQLPLAVQHMLRELVRTVENGRIGGVAGGVNMNLGTDGGGIGTYSKESAASQRDDAAGQRAPSSGRHAGFVAGFAVGK